MSERKIANNHYPGLDVVRVIAIAGIVLMHVLANGNYDLSGFLFEKVIGTAGNFTILFMMVSAFGMCCGYYEKFKAGTINIEAFYLQAMMNTVGEAGDVMHLSQNVVEAFIDRIEVFNDERVKIHFTFEDVLADHAE